MTLYLSGKQMLQECRQTFKDGGVKAVIRRYGWKFFAVFFVYYLVRDLSLYVLLPYLVAKHFL
jgi:hypothetical protein